MSTVSPATDRRRRIRELRLVFERKLFELLPATTEKTRLEASGVEVDGRHLLVAMDNLHRIARLPFGVDPFTVRPGDFVGLATSHGQGFEDLTLDAAHRRVLLLREAVEQKRGVLEAEVVEWTSDFQPIRTRRLPFEFRDANKGFEGLASIRRGGREWLLALCEGNRCRGGKKGREPGGGRIHVFHDVNDAWVKERVLRLPEDLPFEDYAGLAIDGDRVGVVSQASSLLWIGELESDEWEWRDEGQIYEFPRTARGELLYTEIEGLAWLGSRRVAVVSDRSKKKRTGETKDQSLHIFDLD